MKEISFKNNCLNTFRLLAALQVLQGHVIAHLNIEKEPIIGDFISFFSGVPIFFALSGFLIWQSIGRSNSYGEYAYKRFWRIFPELWVAVAVEVVVLLILYKQSINWPLLGLFTIGQATVFQFWTPDFIRGYGCGTPNGALWTITVLIQFYFCVFYIYKFLHKKRLVYWLGGIFFSVIIGCLTPTIMRSMPEAIGKIYAITIFPYLWMFLFASFVSEYKDRFLSFIKEYWYVFIGLVLLKRLWLHWDISAMYSLFDTILLTCGLIGFSYQFPKLNIRTDISYGVYIYHMTVVNALIVLGFKGQSWTYWLVIVITCLFAWISAITIGKMSAKRKHKDSVEKICYVK